MREDQTLPVAVKIVLRHERRKLQSAAARERFQQQMHLRVVAQRFVVPHALRRGGDRFLVNDAACAKFHRHAKAALDHAFQNFQLHLSHQTDVDLLQSGVPVDVQQRVFFLQLAQLFQCRVGVYAVGQEKLIIENRFQ